MMFPLFFRPSFSIARRRTICLGALALAIGLSPGTGRMLAGEGTVPTFEGSKSEWHDGFARFDYEMDEATLAIKPFKVPDGEKFGIKDPAPGKRRCVVVAPKTPAAGNPWSWQGCYWDHQPQTEVALLHRGFHIAYLSANATLKPGREWDAWYAFLTEKVGLSKKPAFIGMSRGGEYAYTWATSHPDAVSCIYADNPGGNREMLLKLGELAERDVPLLQVCGSIDPLLNRYGNVIEGIYQQWGGRVTTMIKEGAGHHPHSLRDAKPLADWIENSVTASAPPVPAFVDGKFTRNSFHSDESFFREYPAEGKFITCRGPGFVPCFQRWQFSVPGADNTITVIAPEKPAAGMPWVFRSDPLGRGERIDCALLAAGFHVVTGPVSYNADGPQLPAWNAVYDYLITRGFSKKPVLEGRGGAGGDAWAWTIANPDKVACVLAINPLLRSQMSAAPLLENLGAPARAGVPVMHLCGSLDPYLESQTRAAESRYKELGGKMTVLIGEGTGHLPAGPADPAAALAFIREAALKP